MSVTETLQKALEKVQHSGLMPANACHFDEVHIEPTHIGLHCTIHNNWNTVDSVDDIIFEEFFAKGLWGDKADYHLQQLKTYDHPLKYIEKFL